MAEQKVASLLRQKIPKHLNIRDYKQIDIINENKEIVYDYLVFLLYLMCNIEQETDVHIRDMYTNIFFSFSDYSLALLYGYEAVNAAGNAHIRSHLLMNFINSNNTICNTNKEGLTVRVYINKEGDNADSEIYTSKKTFDEIIKNCTLVDESNNLKVVTVIIKFYNNNVHTSSHYNTLIIKGNDVYRIEPNIDISTLPRIMAYFYDTNNTNSGIIEEDLWRFLEEDKEETNLKYFFRDLLQSEGFRKGKYKVEGSDILLCDYVNYALFKFFEGTDYNFKGFYTNFSNSCSMEHGGMCVQISSILSVLGILDFKQLKYYTIKFCQNLLEQISRRQFILPPFVNRIMFINSFLKKLYNKVNKKYRQIRIPKTLLELSEDDRLTNESQITGDTKYIFLLCDIRLQNEKYIMTNMERRSFKNIFVNLLYDFFKIMKENKWEVVNLAVQEPETEEKILSRFVKFGKVNTLTRDIKYLQSL
jgi:hypothetical protein